MGEHKTYKEDRRETIKREERADLKISSESRSQEDNKKN